MEQDRRVGRAQADGLSVEVEDGRAVVRALTPGSLELWASAPRLRLSLQLPLLALQEFVIDVRNCMPRSELSLSPADVAVEFLGRSASGTCSYRLGPISVAQLEAAQGSLAIEIEPPAAGVPAAFRFAVLSDVQEAIDRVQDIYRVLNQERDVDFLFGAGDLTEQGTHEELARFQRELEQLEIPYYTTLGNHELGQQPTLYHQYFGRGSQSFEYRGVRFTLLDSASASIDPTVFEWLDEWLALGRDRLHVVGMHIPPLDPIGVRNGAFANRNEAAKLLGRLAAAEVDLTIYGHIHSYYHFENAGIAAHVSGGGGAVPERFDDMGRHYLVVDADPARPSLSVRVVRVD